MTVHIHQGGTVRAYCGLPLAPGVRTVGWESAHRTTCRDCVAAFEWSEEQATPQAVCLDCGTTYSTLEAALAHAQRLAFPVRFAVLEKAPALA